MLATDQHCILTVCLPDARPAELPTWRAASAAEALAIVRLSRVDLLLTGLALPDMLPWQFLRRLRAAANAPRWALVSAELSDAEEVEARSLGAIAVLEQMPDTDEVLALLARLRTRRASSVVPQRRVAHTEHYLAAGAAGFATGLRP
jgi:DNA-binding response OmpR family regulator